MPVMHEMKNPPALPGGAAGDRAVEDPVEHVHREHRIPQDGAASDAGGQQDD